jgi:hypothetical protein
MALPERDLMVPGEPTVADLTGANAAAAEWCGEINTVLILRCGTTHQPRWLRAP